MINLFFARPLVGSNVDASDSAIAVPAERGIFIPCTDSSQQSHAR
jgi:hypothetical protein